MSEKNIIENINNFLEKNKIKIKGGQIKDYKQLSKVLDNIAKSEMDKYNFEKALYFTSNAVDFDSENYSALFKKGVCLRLLGKFDDAVKVLEQHYEVTKDFSSYINLGFCFAELKENDKALEIFNNVIEKIGDNEEKNKTILSLVYGYMGNIYMLKENLLEFDDVDKLKMNYKLAIKYLKKSVYLNKMNHTILNKLGACYYHCEEFGKALYCYIEASKAAPDIKEYKDAIDEFEKSGVKPEKIDF